MIVALFLPDNARAARQKRGGAMRFALLLALTPLLGACAVGPDYETPGLLLPS